MAMASSVRSAGSCDPGNMRFSPRRQGTSIFPGELQHYLKRSQPADWRHRAYSGMSAVGIMPAARRWPARPGRTEDALLPLGSSSLLAQGS